MLYASYNGVERRWRLGYDLNHRGIMRKLQRWVTKTDIQPSQWSMVRMDLDSRSFNGMGLVVARAGEHVQISP